MQLSRFRNIKLPGAERLKLKGLYQFVRENRFNRRFIRYFEWPVVLITFALSLYGLLAVFASTVTPVDTAGIGFLEAARGQPLGNVQWQFLWIIVGFTAMTGVIYFDYQLYGTLSNALYLFNIALLVLVLAIGIGRGGAARFYRVGDTRSFQPSEVGKVVMVISLSHIFSRRSAPIRNLGDLFKIAVYLGLPLVLVVAGQDVGTTLVYIVIFMAMLFVSQTNPRLLIGLMCVGVLSVIGIWFLMRYNDSFRVDRILVWLDWSYDLQGAGMQTNNARIAAGSGGIWGKGIFTPGTFTSLDNLPEDHTDFIFAVVVERFGLVGAGLMVMMYLALILRMVILAHRAQDAFGSYLVVGVAAMMLFHVFENVAMVIGLMPVTGIPLPFVSAGGSNFITNMMGIGLVVNVAMRSRAHTQKQQARPQPVQVL